MTPGILMLIGAVALITGIIGLCVNFFMFVKSMGTGENIPMRFVTHIVCAILYGGGGVALLAGFIWFLVTLMVAAPTPA